MAHESLRRTLAKAGRVVNAGRDEVRGIDSGDSGESRAIQNDHRSANPDDRNIDREPNRTERVSVIEVNPSELGDFIRRDSAAGNGDGSGSEPGRKRRADAGKPRGRRKKTSGTPIDAAAIELLHTTIATLLHEPEFLIDDEEAQKLSAAYAKFAEHHEVPLLTEKRMSEINLIAALITIEGSRIWTVVRKRRKAKHQPVPIRASQPVA